MASTSPLRRPDRRSRPRGLRRGATVVEFAVVAPLAFLTVFASLEFGRMMMVVHGIEETAREACRTAIARTATRDEIVAAIDHRLSSFGVTGFQYTMTPDPPETAPQWQLVTIEIDVSYSDVSWLPVPAFLGDVTLSGSCTLSQESDEQEETP